MIRRPKNVINKVETDPLPLKDCLAKTRDRNHKPKPGRDVLSHCSIVGEVAREIRKRMPEFVKNSLFSEAVMLVAACHDIGKVSPYFQAKIYKNLGKKIHRCNILSILIWKASGVDMLELARLR